MIIYTLKRAGGEAVDTSEDAIVATADDSFVAPGRVWLDPRPSEGGYVEAINDLAPDRERAWERIKAERDRRKANGTFVGGHWFHSDADSRIQQLGLFIMGASVPAVPWKTMSGEFVTMSQSLAAAIFAETAANDQALFSHAESLRAQVDAANDPGSINIMAGWPPSFGDT